MFDYAWRYPRPSGIQRVQHELFHALAQLPEAAGRIGFVRHASTQNALRGVAYPAVAALFDERDAPPRQPPRRIATPAAAERTGDGTGDGPLRRLAYRVPPRLREPLLQLYVNQRASLGALAALARAARPAPRPPPAARAAEDAFAREAAPGDVLAVLGAAWTHPDYARVLLGARRRGLRVALLVHDLIPVFRPEWCDRGLVARFGAWIESVLPLAERVFTVSAATAADLRRYAAMRGVALPEPLRILPPGTGFTTAPAGLPRAPRLPPAGSYVLSVGTVSAHKNQALLFRVWRRLLDELPVDAVPHLVLAGRTGALVADLMQQLHNTRFLDGRVVMIEDPTDAELAQLYEGCRFTVFASLYEGWGLPVTESLRFGVPCIAANATALPEAGGALARYFDPDCATDAVRVIRAAIEEADGLAGWRRQIAEEFRPVSWTAAAQALLTAINAEV